MPGYAAFVGFKVRSSCLQILLITSFCAVPVFVRTQHPQQIKSPDGSLRASITSLSKSCAENRLAIYTVSGALLYRKDFTSSDCEHGDVIMRGQWTADSRFFVFNVESTGGHQPGHKPVLFYSRRSNRLYRLENFIGYIVAQDFTLEAPHIIRTEKQKTVGESGGFPVRIDLDRLSRRRRQ